MGERSLTFINLSFSSSGTATRLGIYVDWGGEDFGARFGANFLETDLGDTNGISAI